MLTLHWGALCAPQVGCRSGGAEFWSCVEVASPRPGGMQTWQGTSCALVSCRSCPGDAFGWEESVQDVLLQSEWEAADPWEMRGEVGAASRLSS